MNSIVIDENSLQDLKRIKSSCNYESNIYINNDRIYKILDDDCRSIRREENIEKLSQYSHPNCVFPQNKLINLNGEFIGLEEEFLRGYKTLKKYLNNYDPIYKSRILLAYKICEIQRFLEESKISFIDLHTDNIMIKDNNIKIIDLDSAEILDSEIQSEVFEYLRKELINKNLARTIYQTMLGFSFNSRLVSDLQKSKLLEISNDKQKAVVNTIFSNNDIINVEDYIDYLDEDYMEESKMILRRGHGKKVC